MSFTHLHVHSQYSILDGAASLKGLVKKAVADGMPALALTDHGNMFGAKLFYDLCKAEGVKPIIGMEAYVARVSLDSKEKEVDRSGEHLVILAKNMTGYKNLVRLCSIAHTDGFYYRPRIDKALLAQYHEGLILCSACLGGEIPQKIMKGDLAGAEAAARWYKELAGDDYYLEIMRHPSGDPRQDADIYNNQQLCIPEILKIAKKLDIKVVATNDVHFLNPGDAEAHDLLICLNTGKDLDDQNRMRYTRQEWFKTTEEMRALFADIPEAVENTLEIAGKVEPYTLDSDPIMPVFPIPDSFGSEAGYASRFTEEALKEEFGAERYDKLGGYDKVLRIKFESDYLEHLSWQGAEERWPDLPDEIRERISFEIQTIKTMGFPGYFLIVQDFIRAAREMGVIVGPGRGSAAGSVVAYCLKITNIDPVRYDLLFERFLNPDRISMPDIDIDFDDDGRQQVLDWVTDKYGADKVAHIVTFGSMAAKMAIKDVARVLKLDLSESNRLAKMVPETPKITLEQSYKQNPLLQLEKGSHNPLIVKTLELAEVLEGSVRQTGIHACGVIIGRDPLIENIPVMATKGEKLLTTQYDGHFVEPIGLLKMDFLGLKTLSIIKIALENIRKSKQITIDIDAIPIDDAETFALFSRGDTTGLFQFESPGMKKHLRALRPHRFEDLVAMNALYRPGPMEYIPKFIARKHGQEAIEYDHPIMESYLKETYGITVYQEQVMLLSRALGNFTRGQSDTLRKAMGKKKKKDMDDLKELFVAGCLNNPEFIAGCGDKWKKPEALIDKIWSDWEAFASYAFNKSHSVCYAYVAYQTGYLKAHYPAEFMAANLSCNLSQIDKVTIFMDECKRMGLKVLAPDVNESDNNFTVNPRGDIRFGLAAIKGVGEGAVEKIIEERTQNGPYRDMFDFFERVDYRTVNKKTLENIIVAGGLDSFGMHRGLFFHPLDTNTTFLDQLVNYGQKTQQDSASTQLSLFGGMEGYEVTRPAVPLCEPWTDIEKARKEKELIGIYLTSHPLDSYRLEINAMCVPLEELNQSFENYHNREVKIAGIITAMREGKTKKGNDFGILTLEDFSGTYEIPFFGDDYIKFRNYFILETAILVKGAVREKRWGSPGEFAFSVQGIDLLHSIGDKMIQSVTLHVDVSQLNSDMVMELVNLCSGSKEDIPVSVVLHDEHHRVKLFSRTCKLVRSRELYEYFENNDAIQLKIN